MTAIAKEKIIDELRNYHLPAFPDKLTTEHMDDMKTQFGLIEDKTIAMLLSLVNGKAIFADVGSELEAFKNKITSPSTSAVLEAGDRALFLTKIDKLMEIMNLAKVSNFQLRKVRTKKAV